MSRLTAVALGAAVAGPLLAVGCTPHHVRAVSAPAVTAPAAAPSASVLSSSPRPTRRASRLRATTPASSAPMDDDGFTAAEWARSRAARAVKQCESGNDGSAHSRSGKYRGFWQIGPNEWRDWGGLKYASSPELATEAEQDEVAFVGFRARGWQPWTCARIVGVV